MLALLFPHLEETISPKLLTETKLSLLFHSLGGTPYQNHLQRQNYRSCSIPWEALHTKTTYRDKTIAPVPSPGRHSIPKPLTETKLSLLFHRLVGTFRQSLLHRPTWSLLSLLFHCLVGTPSPERLTQTVLSPPFYRPGRHSFAREAYTDSTITPIPSTWSALLHQNHLQSVLSFLFYRLIESVILLLFLHQRDLHSQ